METATVVGWSGYGAFSDLEKTVQAKLGNGKTSRIGEALVLESEEPVAAARRLSFLPGIAWVAVGYRFSGEDGQLSSLKRLAQGYLRKGSRFRVSATTSGSSRSAGDVILAANSELLSLSKGAKIDERNPAVRFRIVVDGQSGVSGVQLREGPGGSATGSSWVACLVSGGRHSSAMAWMAALTGKSILLVHALTEESALRSSARLYSELSLRMDPRRVKLVALSGKGTPGQRLGAWLRDHEEETYAGSRPRRAGDLREFASLFPNLAFPLVLFEEKTIEGVYRSLNLGRESETDGGFALADAKRPSEYEEVGFGGKEADANGVLDSLKAALPRAPGGLRRERRSSSRRP